MFSRMASKDLGIKEGDLNSYHGCYPTEPDKNRIIYPSTELRGKQVDSAGLEDVEHGSIIEATVKFRVKGVSDDQSDKGRNTRVDLELRSIEVISQSEPEDSEEEDGEKPKPKKDERVTKMPSAKEVLS